MAARKTVVVRGYGKEATVGWFEGASDESIKTSITSALLMKADSIVARDLDGNVVAVSQAMPSGLTLVVDPSDSVPTTTTARASAEQRTLNFRGQVLKFERVQAHLANERTWLAWVRTALSALTIAFSLLTLSDDASSASQLALFVMGSCMVANVLFTFVTGWLRYVRVKDVLMLTRSEMSENFGRFGLSHQARFMSALLLGISVVMLISY